jgi:hypothetical protein
MELKRAFFREIKKGEGIIKQNEFLKNLIIQKTKILSESEFGESILEKRKLIEGLDSTCKEVKIN